MSRHTPGPWQPVRSVTCGHLRADHNYRKDPREEWTDADIALIAAAPDLLAAAIDVIARCPCDPDINPRWQAAWNALLAAVAKAEGKP